MDGSADGRPEIITHRIPAIEVYHITEDELDRIEEACGQIGQDLTFGLTLLAFSVSFLIALFTATFSEANRTVFIVLAAASGVAALYFLSRWWRVRKTVPSAIARIRSRRTQPEPPSRPP